MKKIFLTSGIIVCMACPAFADPTPIEVTSGNTTDALCNMTYLGTETNNDTVRLEPMWSAYHYDVIFNSDAHGATANQTLLTDAYDSANDTGGATYGEEYTIPNTVTSPTAATGYTFRGWSTSQNPSVSVTHDDVNDVDVYTVSNAFNPQTYFVSGAGANLADGAQVTLYAAYTANPHTIKFYCGDGTTTAAIDTINVTYNEQIGTASSSVSVGNACSPAANHHFVRWDCSGGITGNSFASSDTYDYDTDTTCTAIWSADKINLIWYQSDVATDTSVITPDNDHAGAVDCTVGAGITLPQQPTARPGYNFKGWKVATTPHAAN